MEEEKLFNLILQESVDDEDNVDTEDENRGPWGEQQGEIDYLESRYDDIYGYSGGADDDYYEDDYDYDDFDIDDPEYFDEDDNSEEAERWRELRREKYGAWANSEELDKVEKLVAIVDSVMNKGIDPKNHNSDKANTLRKGWGEAFDKLEALNWGRLEYYVCGGGISGWRFNTNKRYPLTEYDGRLSISSDSVNTTSTKIASIGVTSDSTGSAMKFELDEKLTAGKDLYEVIKSLGYVPFILSIPGGTELNVRGYMRDGFKGE